MVDSLMRLMVREYLTIVIVDKGFYQPKDGRIDSEVLEQAIYSH